MTDTQRTAQELAAECIERMHAEHVKNNGWISPDRFRSVVRAVAAALASQAEPVADSGSEYQRGWDACMVLWADHMKRVSEALNATPKSGWANHAAEIHANVSAAITTPPAPAQAEPIAHLWRYRNPKHNQSRGWNIGKPSWADDEIEVVPVIPAQAEQSEDSRDAARYRWLRDQWDRVGVLDQIMFSRSSDGESWVGSEVLDGRIDAAIAAKEQS